MNEILNENGTIICKNIPINTTRFEITEIFSKYGPLLGEGIYFGKKQSNVFYIKYVHFKDAIKAYESLKNKSECEHDFKVSFSKSDEIKYKAIKGNKKAIEQLKIIYKKKELIGISDTLKNDIINEINEQNIELLRKKKREKEMERKKDKSFILNLLTKIDEPKENEKDNKLKEELKNYLNLNCLCSYHLDENNKFDNDLIPTFPN
ncbi:RNA-binding protein, putative [Plasmodium ovale]|uniref:RNA-binding protein, putative n=1 Tax=Plasmodium ovale TaxID=36330 RepID=A0A1D3RDJ3_PLAOA|nr:RNA-binding protein, putative [Plasmodium ovale]